MTREPESGAPNYGFAEEQDRLSTDVSEYAVEWLSVAADEDGRVWVTDVIDGAVRGPIETAGYPLAEWIGKVLVAVEEVIRETYK